jgi:hypothetical protein
VEANVFIRAKLNASLLSVIALAASGCSVGNGAENAADANRASVSYAPNAAASDLKVAAAAPENAKVAPIALTGTKCFARKDDKGAGGVRLSVQSSGTISGVYYAMAVNAADGSYAGSFGEAQGKLTGSTLSISLDPKGGTSTDLRKSDEIWTLSDKGFSNGTGLYAPADCAFINAEYEKRSSEE